MTAMLLQRRLINSDGWRTVLPFDTPEAPRVQTAAEMLSKAGPVFWRVVRDDQRQQVLAVFDGRRWQAVAEAEPAPGDMPWWQSGFHTAAEWARPRAKPDFAPTVPLEPKD